MLENLSRIVESTEPTVLASGWGRTEGPLWHAEGYVTFVDLEGSRLLRWDPNGQVTVVRENTGEGNGCTLDNQGRLIMCEGADHRRVTRMEADGTVSPIAERWQGKRFHKPNDIVGRSDGSLFFTDPGLRLAPELREMDFYGVFRIDPQGEIHLATDECEYPNGLAFSPDESILYVAISRLDERCFQEEERGEVCTHRRIRAFDVAADGTLSNNRIFCDMSSSDPGVPDGIKVDTEGRVFCAGSGGIWVIDPSGDVIGIIRTPGVVRNLAFGGPDFRTLYLTLGGSLSKVEVTTPGIGRVVMGSAGTYAPVVTDWTKDKNARRCHLIDKDLQGTIDDQEKQELKVLTEELRRYRKRVAPRSLDPLKQLHQELLQKPSQ